jgi:hypothetical protein
LLTIVRCVEQVETLLGTQAPPDGAQKAADFTSTPSQLQSFGDVPNASLAGTNIDISGMTTAPTFPDPSVDNLMGDFGLIPSDDFSWEMIGLGLDEPLPSQDVIDDM